ncbi:MAG TPA: hypothetical protein VNH11_33660 [Pirellulales bacterium]|nr:hypothetical protein [Pirellulales bacterium]
MDPADFISLALMLSNSHQESELRTAVGRAYYGAFHCARELLGECGIRFPRSELLGADIHRKVRFCLSQADNEDAGLVVNRLSSLREQRNDADYDLKTRRFTVQNAANVKATVRIALEIVDALQRCRAETALSALRDQVRAHAHDVLRLPQEGE